jgi:hypothetical protein
MSNEDQTKRIDEPATPPTIETVLERINQLGESLNKRIDEAVAELRADMNKDFSRVEDQLSALNAKIEILRPV